MTAQFAPATTTGVTSEEFRAAFRNTVGTVSVITAGTGLRPVGFTATSLTSVSLDPAIVSFNISRTSSSWPTVSRSRHLAAHLLGTEHRDTARVFATSGIDRFAAVGDWAPGPHGIPVLGHALARLVLEVRSCTHVGDSAVVLAEVLEIQRADGTPLLHHAGRYRHLADETSAPPTTDHER